MQRTVTITPGEYSTNEPYMDFFRAAIRRVREIRCGIRKFADNARTTHGIANLAEAMDTFDKLFDLYGESDSPFSHHSMQRLRNAVSPVKAYYHRVLNNQGVEPGFEFGRQVENVLDSLESIIEEWQKCVSYME